MQTGLGDFAFGTSLGLAFIGGYADASSFLTVSTFTGHLTGNCVLAAVSVATKEWYVAMDRLLAVAAFFGRDSSKLDLEPLSSCLYKTLLLALNHVY
jgi:hypothetical protein